MYSMSMWGFTLLQHDALLAEMDDEVTGKAEQRTKGLHGQFGEAPDEV